MYVSFSLVLIRIFILLILKSLLAELSLDINAC